MSQLTDVLEVMAQELPGFVASAVVFIDSGLPIAEYSTDPTIEPSVAAAYLTTVVKANNQAIKLMAGEQVADDILVTTESHYFLIRYVQNHSFFTFIMSERNEWLGKSRMLICKYENKINDILLNK
ncbi:MAG: hypothetical protein ABFR97_01120 [Thermodesulfobacteriota bacterium]